MKSLDHYTDGEFEALVRRAAALPDAPHGWVRKAENAFVGRPTPGWSESVQAFINKVAAVLTFDSWAPSPLIAGVRGVPSATRHLLFSMQGRDIDLRITATAQHFALAGQILGPDESGVVELSPEATEPPDGDAVHTAPLDELGEFRLEGIGRGTYRMTLRLGGDEIALPPIAVGERPR